MDKSIKKHQRQIPSPMAAKRRAGACRENCATPADVWSLTDFTELAAAEALAREAVAIAVRDTSDDVVEALVAELDAVADAEAPVAELDADVGAGLGLKRSEATAPAVGDAKETVVVPAAHCA